MNKSSFFFSLFIFYFTSCANINDASIKFGQGYRIYWSGSCTSQFYNDSIDFTPISRIMGYDTTGKWIALFSVDSLKCKNRIVNSHDGVYFIVNMQTKINLGPYNLDDFRSALTVNGIFFETPLKFRNERYK